MEHQNLITEIQSLFSMMGIHTKEVSIVTDNDLHLTLVQVRVGGDILDELQSHNKEIQRSLATVFKTLVQKKYHYYKDVILDINGLEEKLINQTKQKAQLALERVEFFDKPYEFGYLNSYERMLIHSYLKNTPHIKTESINEGKDRRLVIKKQS